VLGCGFDYIYPKENEWLFHKILANGGCIITEQESNVEPDTLKFPKRNRIISGIADGVLVVEAEFRSGSAITARYAKEQGKKVYAIPSNIYSCTGVGTNNLIKEGAILVTKPSEIERDFIKDIEPVVKNENINVPQQYASIYNLLKTGTMHINEIAKHESKSISQLNSILTLMEIEGYVTRIASNEYKIKE
jgi:DNA processing protein